MSPPVVPVRETLAHLRKTVLGESANLEPLCGQACTAQNGIFHFRNGERPFRITAKATAFIRPRASLGPC